MAGPQQDKAPTKAEVDALVAAAVEKARAEADEKVKALEAELAAKDEQLAATTGPTEESGGDGRRRYELLAHSYTETIAVPGKPLRLIDYRAGDKIPLTEDRAEEFIRDGVVKDPDAEEQSGKPGGETKAPRGR